MAYPLFIQNEVDKELIRDEYKESLYLTAKVLLGYKDITWKTHGDVIEALEAPTKRKLIVLPRGCFKSSICSVSFPIWLLLRNPNLRILLDSELYTNSKNFLREIVAHFNSEKLIDLWGSFEANPWNEGEVTIRQREIVRKEASLTASGVGAGKTGQHYDVIVSDDLNSPNNSNTKEGREKVIMHYRYNQAILEPGGIMVIVGTRYSADDISGFVLQNEIKDI